MALRIYSLGNFFFGRVLDLACLTYSRISLCSCIDFQLTDCFFRNLIRRNMVKTLSVYGSKFGGLRIVSKSLVCLQFSYAVHSQHMVVWPVWHSYLDFLIWTNIALCSMIMIFVLCIIFTVTLTTCIFVLSFLKLFIEVIMILMVKVQDFLSCPTHFSLN